MIDGLLKGYEMVRARSTGVPDHILMSVSSLHKLLTLGNYTPAEIAAIIHQLETEGVATVGEMKVRIIEDETNT